MENTNKVTCFLPCRAGSQRVIKKNIKPFAHYEKGLIEIKLQQLIKTNQIDRIILTSNDEDILSYAAGLANDKIELHKRVEELSSSETSTDQLVAHALELIPEGHILWTHVTSPFITEKHYSKIINSYFKNITLGYDSLMTVTPTYGFFWRDNKPFNYDTNKEKWPRTQTIQPLQEINSGAFIASAEVYKEENNRIGNNPYLYDLDKITSFDIDWQEDFMIAEAIAKTRTTPPLHLIANNYEGFGLTAGGLLCAA